MGEVKATSVYWDHDAWNRARSAFLADQQTLPAGPDSFDAWIQAALDVHADRSSEQRARLTTALPPSSGLRGFPRTHRLCLDTLRAVQEALAADRTAGRQRPRAEFVREAVLIAADAAQARYGRELPSPPERLPAGRRPDPIR
jgi:hypothetical protein